MGSLYDSGASTFTTPFWQILLLYKIIVLYMVL